MDIVLTRDQVRQVDKLAVSRYGMTGLVLMENAGHNAARLIREAYGDTGEAFICCGTGNNGGDGCVIARHLHNDGWSVRIMVTGDASRMTADMAANFHIIEAMGLAPKVCEDWTSQSAALGQIDGGDVVIDALLGTGFRGEVRSPTAEIIQKINTATKRATVAVDAPSGLDCDTGAPSNATIQADLTITFVACKKGFLAPSAGPYVGRIETAGIGAPRSLVEEIAADND